jgi:hypothetical protein
MVAPGSISTYAPYHQHFIIARLDLDINGEHNTVQVTDLEPLPASQDNPDGLAVVQRSTPLRTEHEGRQDYDWERQRSWLIVNDRATSHLGRPAGYRLLPTSCFPAMFSPASRMFRPAQAIGHDLWVTQHAEDERWPCGEFVVQCGDAAGLPTWPAANRPIADTDVVLWHVFGLFHQPRAEDWPVMPADTASFCLKPAGFFDRNPALDVPPPGNMHGLNRGRNVSQVSPDRWAAGSAPTSLGDLPAHTPSHLRPRLVISVETPSGEESTWRRPSRSLAAPAHSETVPVQHSHARDHDSRLDRCAVLDVPSTGQLSFTHHAEVAEFVVVFVKRPRWTCTRASR